MTTATAPTYPALLNAIEDLPIWVAATTRRPPQRLHVLSCHHMDHSHARMDLATAAQIRDLAHCDCVTYDQ